MRTRALALTIICTGFFLGAPADTQEITGFTGKEIAAYQSPAGDCVPETSPPTKVYLRKATGELRITANSSTDTYEAYFIVPVPFAEQVPILIEVESPHLIDCRFLHLDDPNVMMVARMNRFAGTDINWTAWMLVIENTYADLPAYVPIPSPEELPDSVKQWLAPTDCSQVGADIVQQTAQEILGTTTNLIELADDICDYCYDIPWTFPHIPAAFDAVYALTWGNSCTGHAHAGAALFRALGVPARSLLNIPTWYSGYFDMHWIIDYFVPDYGWVRMETSLGQHPAYAKDEIVTLACNPADEFPLFYPCGIEGAWHTSDPAMGMMNPNWGGAHRGYNIAWMNETTEKIEEAHALTHAVFSLYSQYWGIVMTPAQAAALQDAVSHQALALESFQDMDLDGYIANMQSALDSYQEIQQAPNTTIFFDDFESGLNGWTHGGTLDEWELGEPTYGPVEAHSGLNCWGTDLDDTYENNSECWLMSPEIDLTNRSCAYLSFRVWNWVEDRTQGYVYDPLWLDITTDGTTFVPLCSYMGGVNDDPEIPDVGGWTQLVLDLTKYLENTVNIRFRFRSDALDVQPGSYIDDVHVYGRGFDPSGIEQDKPLAQGAGLLESRPNPFKRGTTLRYTLSENSHVVLEIYDIQGQKVRTLIDGHAGVGRHSTRWDGNDENGKPAASGVYFYKIATDQYSDTRKMVLLE